MDEGQNKRQIGKGMKPRGSKRVKQQKETKQVKNQSTTEGQAIPSSEPVLGPQEGNETPGNLEPENGEKGVQNLEQKDAIVAHDDEPDSSGLEAALRDSANWPTLCAHGNTVEEPCEKCQAAGYRNGQ